MISHHYRGRSCDYSLCFLKSKKCFALPWPIDENGKFLLLSTLFKYKLPWWWLLLLCKSLHKRKLLFCCMILLCLRDGLIFGLLVKPFAVIF